MNLLDRCLKNIPHDSDPVIVFVFDSKRKLVPVLASYVGPREVLIEREDPHELLDFEEDGEEFYLPEGWYELARFSEGQDQVKTQYNPITVAVVRWTTYL